MTRAEFEKAEPEIAAALVTFCNGAKGEPGSPLILDVSPGYEDGGRVWYATLQVPGYQSTWVVYSGGMWSF